MPNWKGAKLLATMVVCPRCGAGPAQMCRDLRVRYYRLWRTQYTKHPHPERVRAIPSKAVKCPSESSVRGSQMPAIELTCAHCGAEASASPSELTRDGWLQIGIFAKSPDGWWDDGMMDELVVWQFCPRCSPGAHGLFAQVPFAPVACAAAVSAPGRIPASNPWHPGYRRFRISSGYLNPCQVPYSLGPHCFHGALARSDSCVGRVGG